MKTIKDEHTIRSMIYGGAVGDALGAPYEYTHARDGFKVKWTGSDKTLGGVGMTKRPAGTFTDDTSMTLASIDSLYRNHGAFIESDMRRRFNEWFRKGAYTIDGVCDDIGNTTRKSLDRGRGAADEHDNGNGSLMRISFLALTNADDETIERVSAVTHANKDCTLACVQWVHVIRMLMNGLTVADAVRESDAYMKRQYGGGFALSFMLTEERQYIASDGYVLNTLDTVIWLLSHHDNYHDTIVDAVSLGGDTDTIASIAGSAAGIMYGYENIPTAWRDGMRSPIMLQHAVEQLVSMRSM